MTHLSTIACTLFIVTLPALAPAWEAPVTIDETEGSFTLSNGIVTAVILKRNGDLRSLQYRGTEVLTDRSGHAGGYWSHDASGGKDLVTSVTISPATNDGLRGEVSVKGISGGIKMGHGPGAAADGDFPADIEIRYALEQGQSGIYTYCVFEHLPEYGAATMTEARFAAKLASYFDWISVDKLRNKHYPRILPEEDKYVYTAIQSENRAFGFSSTTRKLGFYFVNPSVEYLSGGPTKPEFLCHRDTTRVQAPVVLNYWRSSHYGGATVAVDAGESWTRVVGPFLLYINEGATPAVMWRDAQEKAEAEAERWPYDWVAAAGYPKRDQRGIVQGRLVLEDPLLDDFPDRVVVGLTRTPYEVAGRRGRTRSITWQTDAKHCQYWTTLEKTGAFRIPHVAPGTYTLHAFADGVLGEFTNADVAVLAGESKDLGNLTWAPVRHGRQLWEVGTPNRTATEFAGADRFFEPGIVLEYPQLFPEDITYTIGKSQPSKDWFFAHVPHNTDPNAEVRPYRGVGGRGRATPYKIQFEAAEELTGRCVLRLAICGSATRSIDVSVNGKPAGRVFLGFGDGVLSRHQIQGLWNEYELRFRADLLKRGLNSVTLTVPPGNPAAGVVYDYLRLELDEE